MTAPVELEWVSCPIGCAPADDPILKGRDRLHRLPGEFMVVRCRACGLIRTTPRPTLDSMGYYYPDAYGPYASTRVGPIAAESAGPAWKRLLRRALEPKTHLLPPIRPGRMLEIGCGSGSFLHRMAGQGWEVAGLEVSPEPAGEARRLGYPVHTGALETAPDPERSYDLVVSWMVLEHLHDPIPALRKVARWCTPNAWLAVSVPDAGGLEFRLFGDSWYALDVPRHLFHYTPGTLALVLRQAGWRVQRVFWHDNPNNMLMSLRYGCLDRGWTSVADYLLDVAEGRRHPRARMMMGKVLGSLRASGRVTVWARRQGS